MQNLVIKTNQTEVKQDKNGRNYKTVTFSEVRYVDTPFGQMLMPATQAKSTKINCYENNYLGKQDPGYAEPIFNQSNAALGGWFMGSIETRKVEEFDIPSDDGGSRTVNTFTTVVFGDTSSPSYESAVKSTFSSKGHAIMDGSTINSASASELEALRAQVAG